MSATNSITNLFNLKNPNIDFSNFECKYELINNVNIMINCCCTKQINKF